MRMFLKMVPFVGALSCVGNAAIAQTAADVQNAQNQSAIAQANATASNAQAVAQAALTASQLANTRADITNIQSALTMPKASDLRTVSNLTAPAVNAAYYKILSKALSDWMGDNTGTPVSDLGNCTNVFINRPSLSAVVQAYRSTDAKLEAMIGNIRDATEKLKKDTVAPRQHAMIVPLVAGAGAVAALDAILNIAAAAKQVTAVGSTPLSNAANIVNAVVSENIKGNLFDSDVVSAIGYESMGDGKCTTLLNDDAGIHGLSLAGKSACFVQAMKEARDAVDAAPTSPNDTIKADLTALSTLVSQGNTAFQALFTADGSGAIPFYQATQGQALYSYLTDQAHTCILTIKTNSADADTVVRDGTFTSYKLSVETTTTVSWTVSTPSGTIKKAGFKALSTPWHRQELDD